MAASPGSHRNAETPYPPCPRARTPRPDELGERDARRPLSQERKDDVAGVAVLESLPRHRHCRVPVQNGQICLR